MKISKRLFLFFTVCILVMGSLVPGEGAQTLDPNDPDYTDWKTGGKLERLAKYIGTYDYEAVWDDPYVHEHLLALMGADDLAHLKENLQVRGSIDLEGANLILSGGKPHETHVERGALVVSLFDGKIYACLHSQGQTTLYSKEERYEWLPYFIRFSIRYDENIALNEVYPEKDFRWVK